KKPGDEQISNELSFDEIKSYRIQFVNRRFVEITFFLKSGGVMHHSFYRELNDASLTHGDAVMEIVNQKINQFNCSKTVVPKIVLVPSFYASWKGLVVVVFLILLLMAASILHVMHSPKVITVSFFLGAMLIINVLIRRNTDIKFYRQMK